MKLKLWGLRVCSHTWIQKPGPETAVHSLSMKRQLCQYVPPAERDRFISRYSTGRYPDILRRYPLMQFSCRSVRAANQEHFDSSRKFQFTTQHERNLSYTDEKLIAAVLRFFVYLWCVINTLHNRRYRRCWRVWCWQVRRQLSTWTRACKLPAQHNTPPEPQICQNPATTNYTTTLYVWTDR